ncbi:MAG: urocanate hydratase [Candidatus Acidiferrales bacterium]
MVKLTVDHAAGHAAVRAARGAAISCKGWQQEAALRMLMNSLDPEVAETPGDTIIRSGAGEAARDWKFFQAIAESLERLENDETVLVQSGGVTDIFRTHADAPRVLIAGSTAGSWTYVGTQAHLQPAYETLAAAARKYFQGSLAGKLVVSGGMGARGGAQPLAATLNGAAFLGIDADPERIKRRVKSGYCDVMVNDLDEALRILKNAVRKREAASVGLAGNCADVIPELASRGVVPDVLVDQTGAHDSGSGYIPRGLDAAQAAEFAKNDPEGYRKRALESLARQAEGMLALEKMGAVKINFGGDSLARGEIGEGRSALLWAALSGEPADMHRADDLLLEMFAQDEILCRWIRLSRNRARFLGLPARVCWLDRGERARFGLALNDLVARGELKASVAITRMCLDDGSPAPSLRGRQDLRNGLDAVADGTKEMAARIERVVANDTGMGIVEYAGADDSDAARFARESGMNISAS